MPFLEAKAEFTKQMNIVRKHSFIAKGQLNQEGTAVFKAVINTRTKSQSYAVISDELRHGKFVVLAFNRSILEHAFGSGIKIQKVHFFSDGAGGQFKNCYNLSTILNPKLLHKDIGSTDWSFFATAHGKRPVDGVGGTINNNNNNEDLI